MEMLDFIAVDIRAAQRALVTLLPAAPISRDSVLDACADRRTLDAQYISYQASLVFDHS
jgi:hypothetical protein